MCAACSALVRYACPCMIAVIADAPLGLSLSRNGKPRGHQKASEIGKTKPERPEFVAVGGDTFSRVAGVVDQGFLARVMKILTAERENRSASKLPSGCRNFIRLIDDRLHAESSMNIYSEHGFDELIGAVFGQVCQRWIVSSYCSSGSPQPSVPAAILSNFSIRALKVSIGRPVVTVKRVVQSPSATTAPKKASIGATDRKVRVLKHHRAVCFTVEVGLVSRTNQRLRFFLLLGLALDEVQDIWVPAL